jgi:hypothetical protein
MILLVSGCVQEPVQPTTPVDTTGTTTTGTTDAAPQDDQTTAPTAPADETTAQPESEDASETAAEVADELTSKLLPKKEDSAETVSTKIKQTEEAGPEMLELKEGYRYVYSFIDVSELPFDNLELYVLNETPTYWEGLMGVKSFKGDDDAAILIGFYYSKQTNQILFSDPLDVDEALEPKKFIKKLDEELGFFYIPFYLVALQTEGDFSLKELLETGSATFIADRSDTVLNFNMYAAESLDYPALEIRAAMSESMDVALFVSQAYPYTLINIDIGGQDLVLNSMQRKGFNADEWQGYDFYYKNLESAQLQDFDVPEEVTFLPQKPGQDEEEAEAPESELEKFWDNWEQLQASFTTAEDTLLAEDLKDYAVPIGDENYKVKFIYFLDPAPTWQHTPDEVIVMDFSYEFTFPEDYVEPDYVFTLFFYFPETGVDREAFYINGKEVEAFEIEGETLDQPPVMFFKNEGHLQPGENTLTIEITTAGTEVTFYSPIAFMTLYSESAGLPDDVVYQSLALESLE